MAARSGNSADVNNNNCLVRSNARASRKGNGRKKVRSPVSSACDAKFTNVSRPIDGGRRRNLIGPSDLNIKCWVKKTKNTSSSSSNSSSSSSGNELCPSSKETKRDLCPGELPIQCDWKARIKPAQCGPIIKPSVVRWCNRELVCDELGAGIRPKLNLAKDRVYCCTPISMYMATTGELARRFLTGEQCVRRNVNGPPPCDICETVLPPCRGYYRLHECIQPEEYNFMTVKNGKMVLRDRFERYWHPCFAYSANSNVNGPGRGSRIRQVADLAGENVGLLNRLVQQRGGNQCW